MPSKRKKTKRDPPAGYIFRPFITLRNGRVIFAKNCGLKAFKIAVGPDDKQGDLFKS